MANYNNNKGNWNNNHQNKKQNDSFNSLIKLEVIKSPLHEYYRNKENLYMPITGVAYKEAENFKGIASNQLRKILDESKKARKKLESGANFEDVQNKLFSLLPLAAFNAGRDNKLNPLFEFMYIHLNKNSIQDKQDIDVFDELFTSIIAYHKYLTKR